MMRRPNHAATPKSAPNHRRGVTVVMTAVSLTTVMGLAALAIDVGYAYSVKAELQRAADAAALAGASAYLSDDTLTESYDPTYDVLARVADFAEDNPAGGLELELLTTDVVAGHLNEPLDPDEVVDPLTTPFNAVQVTLRRDASKNGEISLFFASIFGYDAMSLMASATAAVDDRFSIYHPPPDGETGPLIPFSVDINDYEAALAGGPDLWTWDSTTQQPQSGSDDINEVWIFPEVVAPGNFGRLNVGLPSQGVPAVGAQIVSGISEEDLLAEIGTGNLAFFDEDGNPVTYTMTGNPGMANGLRPYIESRVGDIVGYFIHDGVTLQGANAEFNVVDIRFGRLMEVYLTGNPNNRRIVIQPTVYAGPGIQTDPDADSSGGTILTLRLIR